MRPAMLVTILALTACRGNPTRQAGDAPTSPEISLTPAAPTTRDDLQVGIITPSVDPEGVTVSYRYVWSVHGGAPIDGDAVLSASRTGKGETWTVRVVATDGWIESDPATAEVTIGNSRPAVASAQVLGGSSPDHPLSCVAGPTSDPDGDDVTLSYAWTVAGGAVDEAGSSLAASNFSAGDPVTCTITPNDGEVDGAAVTSQALTVGNTAPVLGSVVVSPARAYTSSDLTCTALGATDADGQAVTFTYAWSIDGASSATTAQVLPSAETAKGDTVVCTVVPNDGVDDGAPLTSAPIVVRNSAPVVATATLGPSGASSAQALTCAAGDAQDADGDAVTISYAWRVAGVDLAATSKTLNPGPYRGGDEVQCGAVPFDGEEHGAKTWSPALTVGNSPPSVDQVWVTPSPATAEDTLTCNVNASDPDGDSLSVSYAWTVGSASAGSGATLSGAFGKGDAVACAVTVSDGSASDSAAGSPVNIVNAPPRVLDLQFTPASPVTTDAIRVGFALSDADDDAVTARIAWYVNGTNTGVTGGTLTSVHTKAEDVVEVRVTPNDGAIDGRVARHSVLIPDTPPTTPEIALKPGRPVINRDLRCVIKVESVDIEGDEVTYDFAWYVDGVAFTDVHDTDHTGDTVLAAEIELGDEWTCVVTPSDASQPGEPVEVSGVATDNECVPVYPPQAMPGRSFDSHSHGGGYMPFDGLFTESGGELWYPAWAGNTIFRYDESFQQIGTIYSPQQQIMQLSPDPEVDRAGHHYVANWNGSSIVRQIWDGASSIKQDWSYNLGSTAGAVTADLDYVYGQRWCSNTIYVLDKDTGALVQTRSLAGGASSSTCNYGTLHAAGEYLYVGNGGNNCTRIEIYEHDGATTYNYVDSISGSDCAYNSSFDGQEMCVSGNSSSHSCWQICE